MSKFRTIFVFFTAILLAVLSGCATIVSGTKDDIKVNTGDTTGARCTLTNSSGSWRLTTPGQVTVKRDSSPLYIKCKKGNLRGKENVNSHFNGWVIGNILFGAIPGLIIDFVSGASNKYGDQTVTVPLRRAS